MKLSTALIVLLSLGLSGCFGLWGTDPEPKPVVSVTPVEPTTERPTFESQIDTDDAFDQALGAIPADSVPRFEEVVDDIDADSIQPADAGEKAELENDEDKAQRAESEARGIARAQNQDGTANRGLELRAYSDELMAQVKGVRPAVLYFTAEDCEVCSIWEENIRAQAETFADRNALIMMADFNNQATLAAEMKVAEPGWAMMLTGVGEMMGPRPSDRLTVEDLKFIFQ